MESALYTVELVTSSSEKMEMGKKWELHRESFVTSRLLHPNVCYVVQES